MNIKSFLTLTAVGCLLAACQSKSYQISGTAESLADGDTLYLTADMIDGVPSDTIFVENGQFSLKGETDSTRLVMIYSARRNEVNCPFFLEPGTITITLSDKPGEARVSGTGCNEQWQQLQDSVMVIGKEINRIAEHIYGNTVSEAEQQQGVAHIDQLNKRFANVVYKAAERNIDNEFGYFLLTYYPEELIDNPSRMKLIEQLPAEMRQRPAIKEIEETIKRANKTAAGSMLPDFSQQAPDGSILNIKDLIAQNRLTIIDFWASWCGPCRHDMPEMVALYNAYKDKGLGIVGVSLDNDATAWQKAIGDLKMTWPQMSDLKGWDNAAAKLFNITSIPHTIVVDQKGKILHRGLRGDDLRQAVAEKLK